MNKKFDAKVMAKSLKTFWNEPPKGRFLNLKEILCLGVGSLGVSFICNIVNIYITVGYLPTFYNMGQWGSLHATAIYALGFALGLIFTPIYAKKLQHTNSKYGRYKPYILFVAPIVALLTCIACWSPQNLDQNGRIIYAYLTCVPTLFIWSLWFNTWNMFPGVYSPNQQERTDIWSPIGLVMGFAPTVMNALRDPFAALWGDVVAARIFSITSSVLGVIMIFGLLKVKERVFVTEEESNKEQVGMWEGIKMVMKNPPLMILTLALCLGCLRTTIDMVWHIVARVNYASNMADGAKLFGALSVIVGFAATPNMLLLPLMTRKFNNRTIVMFWQVCNVGAYLILGIIGFQNLEPGTGTAILITVLRFIAIFNALGSLQPLMLSEIADYQQVKTGYRLEGFIQTFAYSLVGLVTQLAFFIPAIVQGVIGFNPNDYSIIIRDGFKEPLPEDNILSQELIDVANQYFNIAIWISVVSGALMLICLIFYPLSKKKHAQVVEELKAKSVNTEEIESEQGEGILMHVEEEIAEAETNIEAEITENNENASEEKEASEENSTQFNEQEETACDKENCEEKK